MCPGAPSLSRQAKMTQNDDLEQTDDKYGQGK